MLSSSVFALQERGKLLFPGLALALTIAGAAMFLSEHYGAPVMLFALLIGIAFNFLSADPACTPGLEFASKSVLRGGIVLLGARITLGDMMSIGGGGLATVAGLIAATIACGFVCARFLNKGWRFALLTGASVAICGASAALAIASVIPHNDRTERNVLFTVVAVTTLSTLAMVVYPIAFSLAGLSSSESGFLIGATIHDVAQVVGAGYSISIEAGDIATIVKLLRVAMLPVVLLVVAVVLARAKGGLDAVRLPTFVIGFVLVAGLNSIGWVPALAANAAVSLAPWLLVIAIAALGVRTNLKAMLDLGWQHVAVIIIETLFLLVAAMICVKAGVLG